MLLKPAAKTPFGGPFASPDGYESVAVGNRLLGVRRYLLHISNKSWVATSSVVVFTRIPIQGSV